MPGCLCGVVGMFPTLHVNSPGLALTAYSCQVVTFALPQGKFLMPEDFCAKWFLITWPRTFPFCNSMAPCSYPPGKLGMFQALFRICYHCAAPHCLLCAHSIIDLMLIPLCIKAISVVCALSWCVPPLVCTHIRTHTHTHTHTHPPLSSGYSLTGYLGLGLSHWICMIRCPPTSCRWGYRSRPCVCKQVCASRRMQCERCCTCS